MSTLASLGPLRAAPEILAALRAIDPAADLVHLGGSQWLLGVRRPNPAARRKLERLIEVTLRMSGTGGLPRAERVQVEQELAKELRVLQLCADGFRPIQLYDTTRWTTGQIVEDFRLRDHNWRVRPEAAFKELQDAVSAEVQDQKRTNVVREFFEQEAGGLFRHLFRRARGFLQPGLPGQVPTRRVADTTPTS